MLYDEFTIILPALNEGENIGILIRELNELYEGIFIIVSDDGSVDNTKDAVLSFPSQRVFFLDRKNEEIHGLTASILDASKIVRSKYFIVMDADTQHPCSIVKKIIESLKQGTKLVIASRKQVLGHWSVLRKSISYFGNTLGKLSLLIRRKIYTDYDVLSGFFGVEANCWEQIVFEGNKYPRFKLKGYKILFDFLKNIPDKSHIENIPYIFNERRRGTSKLNTKIYIEFLKAIFT